MAETQTRKVIIVGSGPAGLTAAIYTARANLSPLLIHGPLPGGQLTTTTEVENFPGFPEGIQGPELMQLFEKQAKRFGTEIMVDTVTKVDVSKRPFQVWTNSGQFSTMALIVASGANPRYLGAKNEMPLLGFGVSTCATCDGAFFRNKVIVVVGGGDSACEEAMFLTRFGSKVHIIHRRDELRASKIMRDRVLAHPKVEPIWNTVITEVLGTKETGVQGAMLQDVKTKATRKLDCDAIFVAIGHEPNSGLFKGVLKLDENGYIQPNPNSTSTNVPGVFVCGDVQDHVFRQAITAAGSGCMAAIETERWLEGQHA